MLVTDSEEETMTKTDDHLVSSHIAQVIFNLGWFVDAAVVSEVLLFGLHVIYSLLLGSVLQPGDGTTDPLQQLEAERKTRRRLRTKL